MPWDGPGSIKDIVMNNMYYYVTDMMNTVGGSTTLLILGLFMLLITVLKTACYFGSSAVMVPLRSGIIRDIRIQVYNKLMGLPLRFFSHQKKGDIIARMTGDVSIIESSITSSLEMLIKNPILIIFYFSTLFYTSWQLALFTISVVPLMAWVMGAIGKKLKARSLKAQGQWSEILSLFDETLGGLRIIKAFIAEDKMRDKFKNTANSYRDAVNKVEIRQASAHPVSELLGTAMIMVVLWFGGTLILSDSAPITAPTFIFFMVILYSVLQPLKDLSKAGYAIPRGIASIERVNTIMNAVNDIT
jgi:ATP-binding cassette subfamily B protein/subfamily B ATP-binding cassette protein MsbA